MSDHIQAHGPLPYAHDHGHGLDHPHEHAHDHHHHHDEEDAYYLDQLCMVGLGGAFGAICLALYFWQTKILEYMLGPQFYPFVVASGIGLVLLAVVRSVVLWIRVGQEKATLATTHHDHHHHDHGHEHHHDHDHAHDHHHHHDHAHDHGAEDHDHGWAPWRYVVLLVPVILFLLGLPNKPLEAPAVDVNLFRDVSKEAMQAARFAGVGQDCWQQTTLALGLLEFNNSLVYQQDPNKAPIRQYKELEEWAKSDAKRKEFEGKLIQVIGQFSPARNNDKVFSVVRQRIQCCGADAVFLRVFVFSGESLTHVRSNDWVRVTGQVSFVNDGKAFQPILVVPGQKAVLLTNPEPNFYVR